MSAGTLSPTDRYTRSPGIRYLAYTSWIVPSLILKLRGKQNRREIVVQREWVSETDQ